MYIVSACLAGIFCKYDGGNNKDELVVKLVEEGKAIPLCPEVLGDLDIPRIPCEIVVDENGERRVINKEGKDVTDRFVKGAERTLSIAKILDAKIAILKARSPSCGFGHIYNGKFEGKLIEGNGITADLLSKNNIIIYTEEDKAEIEKLL